MRLVVGRCSGKHGSERTRLLGVGICMVLDEGSRAPASARTMGALLNCIGDKISRKCLSFLQGEFYTCAERDAWAAAGKQRSSHSPDMYHWRSAVSICSRGLGSVTAAYVTFQLNLFTVVVSQATSEAMGGGGPEHMQEVRLGGKQL